jgi:regulator of cell morphogenesis and NO signaling
MENEHQSAGKALLRMRELTLGFRPPKDACNAYRLLMFGLRELESDLHLHIHKENDILFARAAAAEVLQSSATAELCLTPHPSMT